MTGFAPVLLAFTVALALGAQPPAPKPAPPPQPQPTPAPAGKVVVVNIVVDNVKAHETRCQNTKEPLSPTTVLVTGNSVRHCVDGKLLNHGDQKTDPALFKPTLVHASAGDTILWVSNRVFRVIEVRPHTPGETPDYPFEKPMSDAFEMRHQSAPVKSLEGDVVRRYKVSFDIEKAGNKVDPDIVCSM